MGSYLDNPVFSRCDQCSKLIMLGGVTETLHRNGACMFFAKPIGFVDNGYSAHYRKDLSNMWVDTDEFGVYTERGDGGETPAPKGSINNSPRSVPVEPLMIEV